MDFSQLLKSLTGTQDEPVGNPGLMSMTPKPQPAPSFNAPPPPNQGILSSLGVPQLRPDLVTPQNPPGLSPLLSPMASTQDTRPELPSSNVDDFNRAQQTPKALKQKAKAAKAVEKVDEKAAKQALKDEEIVDPNAITDKDVKASEAKAFSTAQKAQYTGNADDLAAAQKARNDFLSNLMIVQAGSDIGRSIAGLKTTDNQLFKDFAPFAERNVSDLLQRQDYTKKQNEEARAQAAESRAETAEEREAARAPIAMAQMEKNLEKEGVNLEAAKLQLSDAKAQSDPNSDVSKASISLAQQMAKQAGINLPIPKGMSYTQLQQLYPSVTKFIDAKMNADTRKEAAAIRKEEKEAAKNEKLDKRNEDFITNRSDALRKSKSYESLVKINNAVESMEASIKQANAAGDVGALYQFIKALDSDSAVREGEIALANSGQSHIANIRNKLSKFGNSPRLMDPKFIKEMRDYMQAVQGAVAKQYRTTADTTLKQAKARGIPEEAFSQIDPLYGMSAKIPTTPDVPHGGKYPPGTVVTVKGKNYIVGQDGDTLTPQ